MENQNTTEFEQWEDPTIDLERGKRNRIKWRESSKKRRDPRKEENE